MSENFATIFSNGIADFRRSYAVTRDEPAEISIPVRKDHIGDVLASLNIYGPVSLKSPPSFRPANEAAGSLSFDPQRVIEDLAKNLSGAKVTITRASGNIDGTLVGLHSEPEATDGEPIEPKFLVLLTEDGLMRIPLREVSRLKFLDDDVQKELDKALERNAQRIKPHSTFVTLAVETEQDNAEAVLQYTLPAAAWKISYRLRRVGEGDSSSFEFQGFAIVDNNTDEDWTDFRIAVVTGEPITFSTDLADSKTPRRDHVNVVKARALGSVEVEEADMMMMAGGAAASEPMMRRSLHIGGAASSEAYDSESVDSMLQEFAETDDAEVHTVGDFSVFESPSPVSIAAQRSAVIPVFQTTLADANAILHYKFENHEERAYRAIQFKNETDHSLGRGVCTVYEAGIYAGSCVLPAIARGDDAMLPHALETGVRLRHERKMHVDRVVALRLTKGFCYTSKYEKQTTHYHVRSSRAEAFELVLDHAHRLREPDVRCVIQREDQDELPLDVADQLKKGVRLSIALNPHEKLRVTIVESRVAESKMRLVSQSGKELRTAWLADNIVHTNGPLADEPGVRNCLGIQSRIDAIEQEIAEKLQTCERLAEKQQRLRKNIGTGGPSEQNDRWRNDLANAEDTITEIEEKQIPELRAQVQSLNDELREALKSLSAEWKDDASS